MTVLKGLGYGCKTEQQVAQVKSLNLDWLYTWGDTPNLAAGHPGFVPMVWSDHPDRLKRIPKIPHADALLGFNEPDHEDQAQMTTGDAIRHWSKLEGTGMRLGSPATVTPNAWWMQTWMKKARAAGLRVDFTATHCYQAPDVDNWVRKMTELYERYGLPVWVTETGVADWDATNSNPTRHSRTEVNEYMAGIMESAAGMPFVERVAWKTRSSLDPIMGTGALFHTDGRLTSTGELYASL